MEEKSKLGQILVHYNAMVRLGITDISVALKHHETHDWNEAGHKDEPINEVAVEEDGQIISAHYSSNENKFWIMTEIAKGLTVVILAEDYEDYKNFLQSRNKNNSKQKD